MSESKDKTNSEPPKKQEGNHAVWDTLGILCTRIIARPFTILISLMTAIYLGPEDKGLVAWMTVLMISSSNIFSFGCAAAVKYHISKGTTSIKDFTLTTILMGLVNGVGASLILGLLIHFNLLGRVTSELPEVWQLATLIIVPIISIRFVLTLALMGDSRFKIVNGLELGISVLYALLLVALVIVGGLGLTGAASSLIASQAMMSFLTLAIVIYKYRPVFRIDMKQAFETYSYGIRTWVGSLCNQLNLSLDSLVVGMIAPAATLGNYSVAVTISRSLMMLPTSLGPVLTNRLVKLKTQEMIDSVSRIHRLAMGAIIVLATVMGILGCTILPWIMPAYADVPLLLVILLVGTVFLCSFSIVSCFFHSNGAPGKPSIAQMLGLIAALIVTPVLVWKYGGTGAALASSATYLVSMLGLLWLYRRSTGAHLSKLYTVSRSDFSWLGGQLNIIRGKLPKTVSTGSESRLSS